MGELQISGNDIQVMQYAVGTNSIGMPIAYVDDTKSMVPLDYYEGYPTINGTPFWERLEGEPEDAYNAFKAYRNMKEQKGTRAMAAAADLVGVKYGVVAEYAKLYHWKLRVQAYDTYQVMVQNATRELSLRKMENRHHEAAVNIFNACSEFFKTHMEDLTPKTALAWLELAIKLERASLGVDPKAPSGPSIAVNINNSDGTTATLVTGGNTAKPDQNKMQEILQILNISGALKGVSSNGPDGDAIDAVATVVDTEDDEVRPACSDTQTNCIPLIR